MRDSGTNDGGMDAAKLARSLVPAEVEWLRSGGPSGDVVMSSRVRLARNIEGLTFGGRAPAAQRAESLERVRSALMASGLTAAVTDTPHGGRLPGEGLTWLDLHDASSHVRDVLVERQLISRQLANGRQKKEEAAQAVEDPRAVAFDPRSERVGVMVNEEDHLRIQSLRAGLSLNDAFLEADAIDDRIEGAVDYAYNSRFGYLTACPTNVGTGIRVSVMLHMPAIRLLGESDKVKRAASDMSLAVRGFWGEGSDTDGDFLQLSNQTTLGKSERVLLQEFEHEIVPKFVEYERRAREKLEAQRSSGVADTVYRALGVLTHARRLGAVEAMELLSKIRLGVIGGWISESDGPSIATVHRLFLLVQPAHMAASIATLKNTDAPESDDAGETSIPPEERKPARAALCRSVLGSGGSGPDVPPQDDPNGSA